MSNVVDKITKAKISFDAEFVDKPDGGIWIGLPEPIKNLLEDQNSALANITDFLVQDEKYRVTIKFELVA